MNIGQRINNGLAKLLIVEPNGPAIDFGKDSISTGSGGHGTHKERGKAPTGNSRPLVDVWAEQALRVAEGIEAAVREIQVGVNRVDFGGTKPAQALRQRIHDYQDRDPVYVAYHEHCSVELVRKVRREKGLDPKWGHPLERNERPLTAPARETLKQYTSTTPED